MDKESDLLNEYFSYFDRIFLSINFFEYPSVYAKYKSIRKEYSQVIGKVNQANFLSTMQSILELDAQLQIMIDLLVYFEYQEETGKYTDEEILNCSLSDYKFYYLEQFGYRINEKKPHTILHFL